MNTNGNGKLPPNWTVPPIWTGETCFILGCGPSLSALYTPQILRHRVIAVNDAFYLAPQADVLYFCDSDFWKQYHRDIGWKFRGRYLVTISDQVDYPNVLRLRNTGRSGLDTDPQCLRDGGNSGYQAIHLAYHFGARRIVLLGFDMRVVEGQVHWRERKREHTERQARTMRETMLPQFETIVAPLAQAGVEVLNATPGSTLSVWPYLPLADVLKNRSVAPQVLG